MRHNDNDKLEKQLYEAEDALFYTKLLPALATVASLASTVLFFAQGIVVTVLASVFCVVGVVAWIFAGLCLIKRRNCLVYRKRKLVWLNDH